MISEKDPKRGKDRPDKKSSKQRSSHEHEKKEKVETALGFVIESPVGKSPTSRSPRKGSSSKARSKSRDGSKDLELKPLNDVDSSENRKHRRVSSHQKVEKESHGDKSKERSRRQSHHKKSSSRDGENGFVIVVQSSKKDGGHDSPKESRKSRHEKGKKEKERSSKDKPEHDKEPKKNGRSKDRKHDSGKIETPIETQSENQKETVKVTLQSQHPEDGGDGSTSNPVENESDSDSEGGMDYLKSVKCEDRKRRTSRYNLGNRQYDKEDSIRSKRTAGQHPDTEGSTRSKRTAGDSRRVLDPKEIAERSMRGRRSLSMDDIPPVSHNNDEMNASVRGRRASVAAWREQTKSKTEKDKDLNKGRSKKDKDGPQTGKDGKEKDSAKNVKDKDVATSAEKPQGKGKETVKKQEELRKEEELKKEEEERKKQAISASRQGPVRAIERRQSCRVDPESAENMLNNLPLESELDPMGRQGGESGGYLPAALAGGAGALPLGSPDDGDGAGNRIRRHSVLCAADFSERCDDEDDLSERPHPGYLPNLGHDQQAHHRHTMAGSTLSASFSQLNTSISNMDKFNPNSVEDYVSHSKDEVPATPRSQRRKSSVDGDAVGDILKSRRLRGDVVTRERKKEETTTTKSKEKKFLFL